MIYLEDYAQLPSLDGSPSQIAWAEKIRHDFIMHKIRAWDARGVEGP